MSEERPSVFVRLGRAIDGLRRFLINVLFFGLAAGLVIASLSGRINVPDGAALVLNPRGTIVEQLSAVDPVERAVSNGGMDFKSASAGPGAIVIEQFGGLQLFDLKTGKLQPVEVSVAGDIAEPRAKFVNVGRRLTSAHISPTGARALFEIVARACEPERSRRYDSIASFCCAWRAARAAEFFDKLTPLP